MKRTLYIEPFSGISGDMMLGALIDLGASVDYIRKHLSAFQPVPDGVSLRVGKGVRHSIEGVKVDVVDERGEMVDRVVPEIDEASKHDHEYHHHHHHTSFSSIVRDLESSSLPARVVERSAAIFRAIAVGEARVHGVEIETVHFHEVGAVDSIVDIVGVSLALESLEVDEVYVADVSVGGGGFIRSQHGMIPIPAPATLEILRGVPIRRTDIEKELTTPTGAGIVRALSLGPLPDRTFVIERTGFGAGSRDLPQRANLLRVSLGTCSEPDLDAHDERDVVHQLEANVDDMNPEAWTLIQERLFSQGALDVWLTPISMKKGRPGALLSLLVSPENSEQLMDLVLRETTSLGVRRSVLRRKKLRRTEGMVETRYGQFRVKSIVTPEGERTRPEADEVSRLAREQGISFQSAEQILLSAIRGEQ